MKKSALLSQKLQLKKVIITNLSNSIKGGGGLIMNPDESQNNDDCCDDDTGFLSLSGCA